jgi:small conductance mechanosensitive channel
MTLVNGKIFADTIQNFSALPVRRVDRTAQLAGSVDPIDAIARSRLPSRNLWRRCRRPR